MGPSGSGLSEVVACVPGVEGTLPAQLSSSWAGGEYTFRSECLVLGRDEHARRSRTLLRRLGAEPNALVGVFPGLADAFTGIRCRAAGAAIAWETWHSYPQSGELVRTAGTLRRP